MTVIITMSHVGLQSPVLWSRPEGSVPLAGTDPAKFLSIRNCIPVYAKARPLSAISRRGNPRRGLAQNSWIGFVRLPEVRELEAR
jgi:hypothetical protein